MSNFLDGDKSWKLRTGADDRYLAEGNDRKIRENETSAEELKSQIAAATDARSTIEAQISIIQDELGRSESYRSNINFNILDRGEIRQIKELQDKIGEIDLDSMAKARKEFNIKYKDKMEEEKAVADKVCCVYAARPYSLSLQGRQAVEFMGGYVSDADK